MRCTDLTRTWTELRTWFEGQDVLVLPRLTGLDPGVRLDCDLSPDRPTTEAEAANVLYRLRQVIERYHVPAVYVGQVHAESTGDLASVTVRVMAGGILHELALTAAWYLGQHSEFDRSPLATASLS
jgi:hypothetical protein